MKVAAVIPNRDGRDVLPRCLDALAAAEGIDEVVVVDDGSSDGSDVAAARREGVRVFPSPGRGFAAAVNAGVAAGRGDAILVLNSDAFVAPDTVTRLAAALESHPGVGACAAALVHEDGSRAKTHDRLLDLRQAVFKAVSIVPSRPRDGSGVAPASFVPLACVLVRREAWDAIGGLDERYRFYFEDHDFARRLAQAGWRLAVDWDTNAVHLEGGSSRVRAPQSWFVAYHESRLQYLRRWYPRAWLLYAAVWIPSALAHAALWSVRARMRGERRGAVAWARAYARAAFAGLR